MARARRSDAGQVKVTERDLHIFEFLSQHKAVYETDLRILIGRYQDGDMPGAEAIRKAIGRWQRGGYARARKVMVSEPRMVTLTPAGAGLVNEPEYHPQADWTAYHSCEAARVRLWMEAGGPIWSGDWKVTGWQSERDFRMQKWREFPRDGTKGLHVPDAVITFANGTEAALEVERSDKTSKRIAEILFRLRAYPVVIYCSQSARVRAHIREVYDRTDQKKPAVLKVYDYPRGLME